MALYAGTLLGFATMMILWFVLGTEKGGAIIGSTLLNMAVFGAMISYAMQACRSSCCARTCRTIIRPYRSPIGIPGALVTIVVAVVTLWYQLQDPVYRVAVLRSRLLRARNSLLRALWPEPAHPLPRKEFATSKGEKGHA